MEKQEKILEDVSLYLQVKKGDKNAFDTLFVRYYPILCAYARQFVSDEDSEEVVQDIMLWLWESRDNHIIETSLGQYLFRSVKNKCFTLINRSVMKQKVNNILHEEMQYVFDDPDFYIVEELSRKIESAIKILPESYRIAFEKNRFQNQTYQQIADELGVSSKTIDYRIQQALKILRVELKDFLPLLLAILSYGSDHHFPLNAQDLQEDSHYIIEKLT
ncbi:RNA polymerase sigma-70 factor [Dysgonomonas sp. Marseille-P4677]|uniref:RNA polymerase sigma-70 factor n=1 Tax=Dysgonomonas sp. Marseille-P4677 TaxID=2364790 RepID=UPI001912EB76|nr:RNA polymerase sigma-70 factor [Dysgonomonas sp. Marseille-P4677]MBK5722585.1 RNA polymerase sigma-70 factor [Dysgonomonas sp. Marseille-P4677]